MLKGACCRTENRNAQVEVMPYSWVCDAELNVALDAIVDIVLQIVVGQW